MSFMEFLDAMGEEPLADLLQDAAQIPEPLHEKANKLFKTYCFVGGMPEIVADWTAKRSDESRSEKQLSLLSTFRDDFNKYRHRVSEDVLRAVFGSVPAQLGGKFVFSRIPGDVRHVAAKKAFSLLSKARVCHRVPAVSYVGVPLAGGDGGKAFKALFMDTGLALAALGVGPLDVWSETVDLWNKGAVAEQVVGQLLRCRFASYAEPALQYWTTDSGGKAEIDYLVQDGRRIVPVEVKAGASGSMKSLHSFMQKYDLETAVRFDANRPSVQTIDVKTTCGAPVRYTLFSFPHYMAECFRL